MIKDPPLHISNGGTVTENVTPSTLENIKAVQAGDVMANSTKIRSGRVVPRSKIVSGDNPDNGSISVKVPDLMLYDPVTGKPKPYPSEAHQYRVHYGQIAWMFDPYTGSKRDPRDIGSDVFGLFLTAGAKV